MKQIKTALLCLFCGLAIHQAVAQKSSQYGPIGRVYHNTVARYNGYYNASNKMKAADKDLSASLDDNYDEILPLDKTELAQSTAIPDIDSIIIRLTVVNKLHPKSKWVDDNLLLIGKAYYMKKDFESAQQTFQYISGTYKPKKSDQKKSQTEGKKLEYDGVRVPWLKPRRSYGIKFKQESVRDEALVWLVKSYIKMKKYADAETIINLIEKNKDFSFKWRDELEAIHAQMLIDQKRYDDAIRPLIYAIAMTDDKRVKTRYVYVLGQLYERTAKPDKAIKAYEEVLTLKPDYKMGFNANISMAKAYAASGKTGGTDVVESLKKLARDEKYAEFRGKLYYTIGEIYYAQNNSETAEEYYFKAIQENDANQKGLAFMRLAEMNFDTKAYPASKNYYDSTLAFINQDYPNLAELQRRSAMLTNLTQQLSIISAQDSLQRLAGMSDKDRDRVVSAALASWERQQQEKKDAGNASSTPMNPVKNEPSKTAGSFYFYNASLKATGYSEFVGKFGNRKNEDNWRRANKKSDITALDNPEANFSAEGEATGGAVTYESLMAGIPTTPEKLQASNEKLAAAYYKLGTIYKEDFNNYNLALQTFETLQTRWSGNAYEPQAWYQMYLIHNAQNDGRADEYRNRLLQKYPNDPLSLYLQNPDYAKENELKSKPAERFYDYAYNLYDAGQYHQAIQAVDSSRTVYPDNPFAAKFDLLKAFAIGQTQPRDSFKSVLTSFTQRYTTGPEQQRAKELLAMLNAPPSTPVMPQKEKKPDEMVSMGSYEFRPNSPQYLVILFDAVDPTNKSVSDSLTAIHAKFHASENLKVNTMLLDEKRQMVMVKQFKNSAAAFAYYNELLEHENLFDAVETTYHMFVIDDKNFPAFFKNKNVDQYQAFFENNYK